MLRHAAGVAAHPKNSEPIVPASMIWTPDCVSVQIAPIAHVVVPHSKEVGAASAPQSEGQNQRPFVHVGCPQKHEGIGWMAHWAGHECAGQVHLPLVQVAGEPLEHAVPGQ